MAQTNTFNSAKPYGIMSEFVKNNTTHEVSEVASNVLRIVNNTGKSVSFYLRFSIPTGWQLLFHCYFFLLRAFDTSAGMMAEALLPNFKRTYDAINAI